MTARRESRQVRVVLIRFSFVLCLHLLKFSGNHGYLTLFNERFDLVSGARLDKRILSHFLGRVQVDRACYPKQAPAKQHV